SWLFREDRQGARRIRGQRFEESLADHAIADHQNSAACVHRRSRGPKKNAARLGYALERVLENGGVARKRTHYWALSRILCATVVPSGRSPRAPCLPTT